MRHLSRHVTLNCGYFGYFRSQKYLPRFRNLTTIVFVFGHLKMSSSQELATDTAKMCSILKQVIYQCVDNLMFFKINPTCCIRNPSIKKLHRNEVFILQKVSKCHSVNKKIINIFIDITTFLTPLCR